MKSQAQLMAAASLMSLASAAPYGSRMIRPRAEAPVDATKALADLHEAVKAMRETNDKRLKVLETNDTTRNESLAELDNRLEEIQASINNAETALAEHATKLAAGGGAASGDSRVADQAYTDNFERMMRTFGDANVAPDVLNALRRSDDADGGYLAPSEWDRTILEAQVELSPIRQIVNVQSVTGAGFDKLINTKGTAAGWIDEEGARPQTAAAGFAKLGFGWGELYAMPAATQTILEDAEVDLETWLAGEVAEAMTLLENAAFIGGDGTNKPRGMLTYVAGAANAARNPLGSVATVSSGNASALTSDALISMTYKPKSRYMNNARWIMNRATMNQVRLLTDGQGNYLWQPTFTAGQPSSLNGYPLTEIADMPDLAANALPIAFGDFRQGYTIFDRKGVTLLRDPYTAKPYVLFYTTKRVGGACVDPEAYFAMRIEA